jgi:hypothetical protein
MIATLNMNQKMLPIAAILTAAALTGILSTAPVTVYADESETSTDQSVKQKNVGSGDSQNFNCDQNLIKAGVGEQCGNDEIIEILTEETTDSPIQDNPLFGQGQ